MRTSSGPYLLPSFRSWGFCTGCVVVECLAIGAAGRHRTPVTKCNLASQAKSARVTLLDAGDECVVVGRSPAAKPYTADFQQRARRCAGSAGNDESEGSAGRASFTVSAESRMLDPRFAQENRLPTTPLLGRNCRWIIRLYIMPRSRICNSDPRTRGDEIWIRPTPWLKGICAERSA
jgi:hypothetical protein